VEEITSHSTTRSEVSRCDCSGLAGRVAVVTGAGSGIGRATCLDAARHGASVALVGRRLDRLENVAAECRALGVEALVVPADLAQEGAARAVIRAVLQRFDRIDALINNAGYARFAPLELARDEDARAMFDTNLLAPFSLTRAAIEPLRAAHGSVVNISSIGGLVTTPNRVMYGALKAALNHMTRSLARELAPTVRVNALLPGPVETPMYDELGLDDHQVAALRQQMLTTTPLGRMGQPVEVARWVIMLIGPAATWVTGSLIAVDGGRST
jgi:NAD(P)-dependent dehydrogenase (short-subunit alcohol dehydrogenase family)